MKIQTNLFPIIFFFLLSCDFSFAATAKQARASRKAGSQPAKRTESKAEAVSPALKEEIKLKKIDWLLLNYKIDQKNELLAESFNLEDAYFNGRKINFKFSILDKEALYENSDNKNSLLNQKIAITTAKLKFKIPTLKEKDFYFEFIYKYNKSEFMQVFTSKLIGREGSKIPEDFNVVAVYKEGLLTVFKNKIPKFSGRKAENEVLTLKNWSCYEIKELLTSTFRNNYTYFLIRNVEYDFKEDFYILHIEIKPKDPYFSRNSLKTGGSFNTLGRGDKIIFLEKIVRELKPFIQIYLPELKSNDKILQVKFRLSEEEGSYFADYREGKINIFGD